MSKATFGILSAELHLPASRSLKDKRRVVKSLVERLHQRFRLSVAETGYHDLLQRAEISMAAVTTGEEAMERLLEEARAIVESDPAIFLTRWDPQILEEAR